MPRGNGGELEEEEAAAAEMEAEGGGGTVGIPSRAGCGDGDVACVAVNNSSKCCCLGLEINRKPVRNVQGVTRGMSGQSGHFSFSEPIICFE